MSAVLDTEDGDDRRHRVVVIGSGFGGLTATKGLGTVSRHSAVAKVGSLELSGFVAWVAWLLLHLVYLVGFKSTMTTVISWTATVLTMTRGQLTITGRQARAQQPVEQPTQADAAAKAA